MLKEKEPDYGRSRHNLKRALAVASLALVGTCYSASSQKATPETGGSRITSSSPAGRNKDLLASDPNKKTIASSLLNNQAALAPLPEGGYTYADLRRLSADELTYGRIIRSALSTTKQQESFDLTELVPPKYDLKRLSLVGSIMLENTSSDCAMVATFTPNSEGVSVQPFIAAYGGVIIQPGVLEGAGNTVSEVQHIETSRDEIPNGVNNVAKVIQYASKMAGSACAGLLTSLTAS